VGDRDAELGFAGLAVQAGVKSALASLWYVSDLGTFTLMSKFYQHLRDTDITIKAEALRQGQLALLRREVDLSAMPSLPFGLGVSGVNMSHPYYWSGFMMVGSPW
jgi:CHAT domain-containing protein